MRAPAYTGGNKRLPLWRPALWLLTATTLVACTSSDGSGGGSPGGGQSPDPVVLDFPIAYVKRAAPTGDALSPDARELLDFQPGADLFLRDRASPSSAERNITAAITQGRGDVRDVEPSFDGTRLVFALREPEIEGADPEDQPTWDIWEYDLATQQLRPVIASDTAARVRTSRRPTCRTAGSSSPRRGSGSRRPSCSTKASRSSRRRTRATTNPRSCCT
jgi:hypothetical protein